MTLLVVVWGLLKSVVGLVIVGELMDAWKQSRDSLYGGCLFTW